MFCVNCGKDCKDGAKFCPECGADLSELPADTAIEETAGAEPEIAGAEPEIAGAEPAKERNRRIRTGYIIGAAVLLVCVIIGSALIFGGRKRGADSIPVLSREKSGFIFRTENKLVDGSFDFLIMKDGEGRHGVVDSEGRQTIPFEYEDMIFVDENVYPDRLLVMKDRKCGMMSADGKVLCDIRYDGVASYPQFGRVVFYIEELNVIEVADMDGTFVGRVPFGESSRFSGLTCPDVVCVRESGAVSFIRISDAKTLNSYSASSVRLFVENGEQSCCVLTDDEDNATITDIYGAKADKAAIRSGSGKALAEVTRDECTYVRVLNGSGVCLVSYNDPGDGSPAWKLTDMKSGEEIFSSVAFNCCSVNEEYELVTAIEKKGETFTVTVYDFDGRELARREGIYSLTDERQAGRCYALDEVDEDHNDGIAMGVAYDGFYFQRAVDGEKLELVFQPFKGDEKVIAGGEVTGICHTYIRNSISNPYHGSLDSRCYKQPMACYFTVRTEEGGLSEIMVTDKNNVIMQEGLDFAGAVLKKTVHGVWCQGEDGKVYWYNRKG